MLRSCAPQPISIYSKGFPTIESAARVLANKWQSLEGTNSRVNALKMSVQFLRTRSSLPWKINDIIAIAEEIRGLTGYAESFGDYRFKSTV